MTVFLTSSPCVFGADRAILNPANGFLERLGEAIPPEARCLFICSDPDSYERTDRIGGDMEQAFREAGFDFSDLVVLDHRNAWEAEAWIRWSDVIILAGGHVPTQNAFFRRIGLRDLLEDYEGVVIGISAGSMNCASIVYAQPELDGEAVDPAYQRYLSGLGLTDIMVLPHYQKVKDNIIDGMRLYEDVTYGDSYDNVFLAIVDGSYVLAENGTSILFGEGYCIENGEIEQICEVGGAVEL